MKERPKAKDNPYITVYAPQHPFAYKNRVPKHRLVIEKKIGRYLKKDEFVHHINCVKNDNRLTNLVVCKSFQHNLAHKSFEKIAKELIDLKYVKFNRRKFEYEVIRRN